MSDEIHSYGFNFRGGSQYTFVARVRVRSFAEHSAAGNTLSAMRQAIVTELSRDGGHCEIPRSVEFAEGLLYDNGQARINFMPRADVLDRAVSERILRAFNAGARATLPEDRRCKPDIMVSNAASVVGIAALPIAVGASLLSPRAVVDNDTIRSGTSIAAPDAGHGIDGLLSTVGNSTASDDPNRNGRTPMRNQYGPEESPWLWVGIATAVAAVGVVVIGYTVGNIGTAIRAVRG